METQHGMLEQKATEMSEYELLNSAGEQNVVDKQAKSGMRNSLY